jgi:hypothetical protein
LPDDSRLWDVHDIEAFFRITRPFSYTLLRRIPGAFRLGSRKGWRVRAEDVYRYVASEATANQAAAIEQAG